MYQPITDDELEEKYIGQLDDDRPHQYAFFYGTHLYEIAERHDLIDIDLAEVVLYWLNRYISQEKTEPDSVKRANYIIAKLLYDYPELRDEFAKE